MLVVFDARATSVPQWLAASGFALWEGVEVAGAEYRLPYVYKVCCAVYSLTRGLCPASYQMITREQHHRYPNDRTCSPMLLTRRGGLLFSGRDIARCRSAFEFISIVYCSEVHILIFSGPRFLHLVWCVVIFVHGVGVVSKTASSHSPTMLNMRRSTSYPISRTISSPGLFLPCCAPQTYCETDRYTGKGAGLG